MSTDVRHISATDRVFNGILAGFIATLVLSALHEPVLLVTEAPVDSTENLRVVRIPEVPDVLKPILEILPVQLLTHHVSKARGLAADGFRHEQEDTKLGVG